MTFATGNAPDTSITLYTMVADTLKGSCPFLQRCIS